MEILKNTIDLPVTSANLNALNKNGIWINATQMAKPFGKNPAHWLRTASARHLLSELSRIKKLPASGLVKKIKRTAGNLSESGTWLHEDAAMEFARWLSPAFALWSNQRTKELLLNGSTSMSWPMVKEVPAAAYQQLITSIEQWDEAIYEEARKVDYHDAVLQSKTLIPTNVIAKELGMSAITLNKLLHKKKIIYKMDEHWVLYAEYCGKGYTGTKTAIYRDSKGNYQSNIHTYWTEKGRNFIHEVCNKGLQAA